MTGMLHGTDPVPALLELGDQFFNQGSLSRTRRAYQTDDFSHCLSFISSDRKESIYGRWPQPCDHADVTG
jgi:hypothetical protein